MAMFQRRLGVQGIVVVTLAVWPILVAGQLPLAPGLDKGRTVTPAFEGWYPNPDGTFTLSFGYYNRNLDEVVDIPIGPNNRVEPGGPDQGQPTHFLTRRHWGVFTVNVPKDFGNKEITWTLVNRGQTLSVPGNLKRQWMIDAISGDAHLNKPPIVKFDPSGPTVQGPHGIHAPAQTVTRPNAATFNVYATDDGIRSIAEAAPAPRRGERQPPIGVIWIKHRGPGEITFSDPKPKLDTLDIKATTTATFSEPGDYIVRAHVFDSTGEDGSNQCCWSNVFFKVTVK
jgi:hypothetical protein